MDELLTYIGQDREHQVEMMKLAWLLGTDECKHIDRWNNLARKFFTRFRSEILEWCGYDRVEPWSERVPVNDQEFLIDLFGQMKVQKYWGDISFEFLTEHLYVCFGFQGTENSFCTDMKEHNSAYSDCIARFLEEINEIKKKNRK